MRTSVSFLLAFLTFGCSYLSRADAQSIIEGEWIGGCRVAGNQWVILKAQLKRETDTTKGTIEARSVEGSTRNMTLTKIAIDGFDVSFEAEQDSSRIVLSGKLRDNMLTGSCQQNSGRGFLELRRVPKLDLKIFDDYVGSYNLGSGNFISVGRQARLGPDMRLGFVERRSGRRGTLTAISETEFFSGPALGLAYPIDVYIRFVRNKHGKVTALTWKSGHGSEKSAPKMKVLEHEVKFRNGEVTLTGNLLLPATKPPHPALILVHGSTPLVRYYFGADPYMFPVYGIAVLVYDKRGVGASTGPRSEAISVLASDALAAVEYLKNRPEIDQKQIGLFGHSQGGWVVPNAASRSKDIAFIIAGAASGLTEAENVLYEIDGELRYAGFSDADRAKAVALFKFGTKVIDANGEGWNQWREQIAKLRNEPWFRLARTPSSLIELNDANRARIMDWIARNGFERFDPVAAWERILVPTLVYQSEWDSYVPAKASAEIIEQALARSGNRNYTVKVFPKSNHGQWAMETDGPNNNLSHRVHYDLLFGWLTRHIRLVK